MTHEVLFVAAVFFSTAAISYGVGFGIEMFIRKDVIWGRPKSAREIAIGEIPSSVFVGALVTSIVELINAVT